MEDTEGEVHKEVIINLKDQHNTIIIGQIQLRSINQTRLHQISKVEAINQIQPHQTKTVEANIKVGGK